MKPETINKTKHCVSLLACLKCKNTRRQLFEIVKSPKLGCVFVKNLENQQTELVNLDKIPEFIQKNKDFINAKFKFK